MRASVLLLTCTCLGCVSSTDAGAGSFNVKGTWSYTAVQSNPVLNISGSLNIDQQSGGTFNGTVQFTETDVQGTAHSRTGALSGTTAGADVVDFDVFIDNTTRRHVARLVADSMGGTWAYASGSASITGSFSAKRIH